MVGLGLKHEWEVVGREPKQASCITATYTLIQRGRVVARGEGRGKGKGQGVHGLCWLVSIL
jgi:hypothetical protein